MNTAVTTLLEDKKVLVIVTDGYENASREYTGEAIKKLVEEKKRLVG